MTAHEFFERNVPLITVTFFLIASLILSGFVLYRNHELNADRLYYKLQYETFALCIQQAPAFIRAIPDERKTAVEWCIVSQAKEIADLKQRMSVLKRK